MQFKKYHDVVNILCTYENTLEDIYVKAGLIEVPKGTKHAPSNVRLSGEASRPDQPGAHARKNDDDDHMKQVEVPFGGDQLTRVCFVGAKGLTYLFWTSKFIKNVFKFVYTHAYILQEKPIQPYIIPSNSLCLIPLHCLTVCL